MKSIFKPARFLTLILPLFALTSCMNVTEHITIHEDGSGTMSYKLDLSDMGDMLAGMGEMEEVIGGEEGGEEVPDTEDMKAMFSDEAIQQLIGSMQGITNVKNLSDADNWIMAYSFDFDELPDLNLVLESNDAMGGMQEALGQEAEMEMEEDDNEPRTIKRKGKKIMLTGRFEMPEQEETEEEPEIPMEMMLGMMSGYSYRTVYHFDREVKKVKKNDNAIIGADGKSVIIDVPISDLLKGEGDLGGQIKLK